MYTGKFDPTAKIGIYISNRTMKSQKRYTQQPTKTELIAWTNQQLPSNLPKIKDIAELGNGVAYLYIMNRLRPGSVRVDKIVKQPNTQYLIRNNLKTLAEAFHKQGLAFPFQVDKLAQRKYQDNFHLASMLYKLQKTTSLQKGDRKSQPKDKMQTIAAIKKVRIIPPKNGKTLQLKKEQPPQITPQDLREEKPLQKLQKEENVNSVSSRSQLSSKQSYPTKPFTLEDSYHKCLRQSLQDKSKYLKLFNHPEKSVQKGSAPHFIQGTIDFLKGPPTCEQDNESMLLSEKKEQIIEKPLEETASQLLLNSDGHQEQTEQAIEKQVENPERSMPKKEATTEDEKEELGSLERKELRQ